MLIVSLKQHFPARLPEWHMAGLTFLWGVYVALHPGLFVQEATRQVFSGMFQMVADLPYPPSVVWGVACILVGGLRLVALFINGAYSRTPLIRLMMSFASAFIWTQVVIGLIKTGVPNTGLVIYSGLVLLDIMSAYRAGVDVVWAEKTRHDYKQGQIRARSDSILA